MGDVFVSYARDDRDQVRELVGILENAGFSVWWDRALEPGAQWADVIERELRRARCVVVVWSTRAIASRWVGIEANEARRRGILVPVAIEPVRLPDEFALIHRLQWFELTGEEAGHALVEQVRRVIRSYRRRTRVPLLVAAAAAAAVIAAVLFWPTPRRPDDVPAPSAVPVMPAPNSVAVLPFTQTDDPQLDESLADGIALELIDALTGIDTLRVSARIAAWTLPPGLPVAEIRRRLGVAWLVVGDVSRFDDAIRVRLRIVDSISGMQEAVFADVAAPDRLADLGARLVARILETLPDLARRPVGLPPAQQLDGDAYRLYLIGQALLRDERSTDARVRAESYFRRALDIAPDYAQALAGQCEARLWRYDQSNDPTDLDHAAGFCDRAHGLAPDDNRVLLATGRLAVIRGDTEASTAVFRQLLDRDPYDADARIGLAQTLAATGEVAAAEAEFRRAIEDQPGYWMPHNALANFLLQQGMAEAAVAEYVAALDYAPEEPNALSNLGGALLLADELPAAISALQRSLQAGETPVALSNLGTAYYYAQRFDEAAKAFDRATALNPTDFRLWGNLADAWSIVDDPRAASAYRRAETLARENLERVSDSPALKIGIEAFRAARGESDPAALEAALQGRSPSWETEYLAAVAWRRLGAAHRATEHLRDAIGLGFPLTMAKRDPLLADLLEVPATGTDLNQEGEKP